ncbi:MAG: DsbA family protein [Arenibacterium sp.]
MNRLIAVSLALVALAIGAFLSLGRTGPTTPEVSGLVSAAFAQDADIDTSSVIEMSVGSPDAPITLIEYASYTCPHCASFHKGAYQQIKENYIDTGKVRLIYREVYFDRYGLWASMVARCGGPEKFFGINDIIYDTQAEWTRAGGPAEIAGELRKIGLLAGLDKDALEACLSDGTKAQTLVAWYQENAEADDVTGTPSFVLNGRKIANQSYADFARLFDEELGS